MLTLAQMTDALLRAARAGAGVCLKQRSRAAVSFKPLLEPANEQVALAHQVVTSADLAVQETVLQSLLNSGLGDCALEAEEDTPSVRRFSADSQAPTIFVDPIDGTLTYVLGCDQWPEAAVQAGFSELAIEQTILKTDAQLYGIVLGASVPNQGYVAVCGLPESNSWFYASGSQAFRDGVLWQRSPNAKTPKVAIGRRLVDSDGKAATPFSAAGIDVRWFTGSAPGFLWWVLKEDCTGYASLNCAFDVQLAALVAQCAGFVVTDRTGEPFVPFLRGIVSGIVVASTADESARVVEVLQQYP